MARRLDALDARFGAGASYSLHDRELILAGVVPEWLLRARLLLRDTREGQAAAQEIDRLVKLHEAVKGKIR